MKKFISGRYKVLIYAAIIILAGAGVLITAVTVAQGAEEKRIIAEQSENIVLRSAPVAPSATEIPASVTPEAVETETEAPVSATPRATETGTADQTPDPTMNALSVPGPQYITEDEAKNIFINTGADLFGKSIDINSLTATFDNQKHAGWSVETDNIHCYIDAISGVVITFDISGEYTGKKITLGEFDSGKCDVLNSLAVPTDMNNSPDNIYIKAALQLVNTKLAHGRKIDNIQIDAAQFVWDINPGESENGANSSDIGTIQVDCDVFMHTGYCYRLSFWGTENPELRVLYNFPTKDACWWGYFYEEEAGDYPPAPIPSGWQTAPGITPVPTNAPGN